MHQFVGAMVTTKNTRRSVFSLQAFRYNARISFIDTERELANNERN